MNLSMQYLGLELPHPFIAGAGPLSGELDTARRLEDAGAAALVLPSLFEEQIAIEQRAVAQIESLSNTFGEALSFFPRLDVFGRGPDEYLEHLRKLKGALSIPIVASLNGQTEGGWLRHAHLMEEAGADALELNLYHMPTNADEPAGDWETRTIAMVRSVKENVKIPLAVKLTPVYGSPPHLVRGLEQAGADGVVLFNRFYLPDIDVEKLEVVRSLHLSTSAELLPRLRWLAILSGRFKLSFAATGGVHSGLDALKAVMAGADAVQMVSALLRNGPEHLRRVRDDMAAWLDQHEYESLAQAKGSMNLLRCPNPGAYERANYVQILQSWGRQ